MSFSATISAPAPLTPTEQAALIKLLADEDPAIYQVIREKITSCGDAASTWLRPHLLSNDPTLRRHVSEIINHFDRQHADTQFLSFCLKFGEEFDLESAAWALARTAFPNINVEAYQALLDEHANAAREKTMLEFSAEEKLTAFNSYLFSELEFTGNAAHYYDPENSYLNRVLDRRTGNPINLTLLYILIARRLGMPVIGIGMPGHFICRYQTSSEEIYIDPFNQGQLLSKADCVQYLQRGNYSLADDFLAPSSARRMFLRICSNLHQIYTEQGKAEEVTRFQRYLVALAR
jgi:regulator of sirC expression with transglutaminase-like and TPR domain